MAQALRRTRARPVSGVLVLSDGRSSDAPSAATIRDYQADRIPIFAVALGSADPVADLAIDSADAPGVAFAEDVVPVNVAVILPDGSESAEGVVRLIDKATGEVLDSKPIGDGSVTLVSRPTEPGRHTWLVRLEIPGGDLIPTNNEAEVRVEVVDRPLRVLLLDGYPRWEYRYLKNLLLRERSIVSSSMLVAADRRYVQEGDVPLTSLPRTAEQWDEFDVVILGDFRADLLSREQMLGLREHVAKHGGGVLWLAGAGPTPESWVGTELGRLLPVSMGSGGGSGGGEGGFPRGRSR